MITLLLLGFYFSLAQAATPNGLMADVSLGRSTLTIENADGSRANYSGLGGLAKGYVPLWSHSSLRFDLTASLEFLDYENSANGAQSEYAQYLGPGLGVEFSYGNLFAGTDYRYFRGRHTTVGPFANKVQFDLQGLNYSVGLRVSLGAGLLALGYSQMTSVVPSSSVSTSKSAPWENSTLWVKFIYDFKVSTSTFVKSIFGG